MKISKLKEKIRKEFNDYNNYFQEEYLNKYSNYNLFIKNGSLFIESLYYNYFDENIEYSTNPYISYKQELQFITQLNKNNTIYFTEKYKELYYILLTYTDIYNDLIDINLNYFLQYTPNSDYYIKRRFIRNIIKNLYINSYIKDIPYFYVITSDLSPYTSTAPSIINSYPFSLSLPVFILTVYVHYLDTITLPTKRQQQQILLFIQNTLERYINNKNNYLKEKELFYVSFLDNPFLFNSSAKQADEAIDNYIEQKTIDYTMQQTIINRDRFTLQQVILEVINFALLYKITDSNNNKKNNRYKFDIN